MKNLVSVITINLNNKTGLVKTVESVLLQTYPYLEYIVIDGGSTDGSFEFIQSVSTRLAYFTSEEDEGIYSAMNKGIHNAKGEYLIFLNSGDFFYDPNCLASLIGTKPDASIIYGNMLLENNGEFSLKKYPHILDINYFSGDTLPHPSTLIRKELFLKYGLYNLDYKIVSDWAFFLDTIVSRKVTYRYKDIVVSVFNLNGISSQPGSYKIIKKEMDLHFRKYYPLYFFISKIRWGLKYYPTRIIELAKSFFAKPI